MPRPTASKSAQLIECSWWAAIPETDVEVEGLVSEAARYGSAFHELIAAALGGHQLSPSAVVDKYKLPASCVGELDQHVKVAEGVLRDWLNGGNPWGLKWEIAGIEHPIAFNPTTLTSREVKFNAATHDYGQIEKYEIPGTIDLLGSCVMRLEEGGRVWGKSYWLVLDHKTGSNSDYSSPETNPQLLTLGAAVNATHLAILHTPRETKDAIVYCEEVTPADHLLPHANKLKAALDRIGDGSMRPGSWCRYCAAKSICPAGDGKIIAAGLSSVTEAGGIVKYSSRNLTTPANVGKLHLMMATYDKLRERAREEIRAFVEANPGEIVTRPDGKCLQLVPVEVERLSKAGILRVLGLVEGGKLIEELRERGVLKTEIDYYLRAVDDD